jgi:4-hydroxythreonine-4-phosphate dehydrogenase
MSRSTYKTKQNTGYGISIGITQGEPSGISPQLIASSVKKIKPDKTLNIKIIAGQKTSKIIKKLLGKTSPYIEFVHPNKKNTPCELLKNDALASIYYGALMAKNSEIDALVTAPVDKSIISKYYKDFSGHTGFLKKILGSKNSLMFMNSPSFKIGILTEHLALKDVSKNINKKNIISAVKLMNEYMSYYKKNPVIGLLALNPHAGDGGLLGKEENDIIIPTIKELKKLGLKTLGPIPADSAFVNGKKPSYDAVLAMYHDQGMIPSKIRGFDKLVNITLGLPIIRTSPGHGVAYDIKNKKDISTGSMIKAIETAIEMTLLKKMKGKLKNKKL